MSAEVTVTARVRADPQQAFVWFTEQVDRWWLRGPRFRRWRASTVAFSESWLTERHEDQVHRVARVVAWQPGSELRLVLDGDDVVVRFEPDAEGTRVTVTQTRGGTLTAFQDPVGLVWADLLSALAAHA